jgi:hypothetical protein
VPKISPVDCSRLTDNNTASANIVLHRDSQQVGVQPDDTPPALQQTQLGRHSACGKVTQTVLYANFVQFRMVIGAIRVEPSDTSLNKYATVVAVRKTPASPIKLIATTSAFGPSKKDIKGSNLPREITFNELVANGTLVGRFEGAVWADIQWYFNYCADNNNIWPAGYISFPSTEGAGPKGRKGGVCNGKAVADKLN